VASRQRSTHWPRVSRSGWSFRSAVRGFPRGLEPSVYFFCSEALANITKHAQADIAWVRMNVNGRNLMIEVSDDGVGGADTHPDGALAALEDRIAALGGTLEVTSPPSSGTTLKACLPLPQ
jgi:signal transduction histidine kinase